MSLLQTLRDEFAHEAATTRRLLERLPDAHLDWRPHQKSFTARNLGSHLVDCVGWTDAIFTRDVLDLDPATYRPYQGASMTDVLAAFDDRVAAGTRALAAAEDAALWAPWRLTFKGRVRFEKPRVSVFRDFTLSHTIHHRGQLSVYLRLLDVPVPGSYGPTADEPM
jgi:uncharacterized damage-inducible protein DinB